MGSTEPTDEELRQREVAYQERRELQLAQEAATWCIADPEKRREKMQRERIRHPKLLRDLLLDRLDTSGWNVLEIGGGPEPLSDILPHGWGHRLVIDPCTDEYRKYFNCPDHLSDTGEAFLHDLIKREFDLCICTNALDHVREPVAVMSNISSALKAGGYFAVMCAENNALTNPHPCHTINLTAADIHRVMDWGYETVWELNYGEHGYRYGWAEWNGKVGQPAFAMLLRKVYGYE